MPRWDSTKHKKLYGGSRQFQLAAIFEKVDRAMSALRADISQPQAPRSASPSGQDGVSRLPETAADLMISFIGELWRAYFI